MKLINKKRKLIFEFEDAENGTMVTTRIKGKLKLGDILCAKDMINKKVNKNVKNKRK